MHVRPRPPYERTQKPRVEAPGRSNLTRGGGRVCVGSLGQPGVRAGRTRAMSDSQKAISFLSQPVGWTINDILGLILLLLSLGGNAYQWQQQRVYSKTIYNGLVAAFNSIGWLLVRT